MKLNKFDTNQGLYEFILDKIDSQFHAHPAIEIIFSPKGGIALETSSSAEENNSFVIIDSNINHRIELHESATILMLECKTSLLRLELEKNGLILDEEGIYIEKSRVDRSTFSNKFRLLKSQGELPLTSNERIKKCFDHLNDISFDYGDMLSVLKNELHLSESRISHLFKEEVGISLKKYMVWNRLKRAFEMVLKDQANMYEAAFRSGFYDQAHLSKAFKNMLGITPSSVYNSRMIQD